MFSPWVSRQSAIISLVKLGTDGDRRLPLPHARACPPCIGSPRVNHTTSFAQSKQIGGCCNILVRVVQLLIAADVPVGPAVPNHTEL